MKLPQPRSSSLPAPSSRLTTPTPSASISIGQTFSMAGVKPTTEPTTASAMSTKIATTATKRRHIVDFYESRRATRDPDGEQTLRNKDQLVFEGLQSDDIKAQLTAADAMLFCFHQPFGAMIKDAATDVLSVAKYIQEAVTS